MQALVQFAPMIKGMHAFFAPAGRGPISVVDVRDIALAAFLALTESGHDRKIYDLTGSQSLTHAQMAHQLSRAGPSCPLRQFARVDGAHRAVENGVARVGRRRRARRIRRVETGRQRDRCRRCVRSDRERAA